MDEFMDYRDVIWREGLTGVHFAKWVRGHAPRRPAVGQAGQVPCGVGWLPSTARWLQQINYQMYLS